MDQDRITIASATGVEVTLTIAGPGTRSYAFIIDFHIRLVLALAWLLLGSLATVGHLLPNPKVDGGTSDGAAAAWLLAAVLPSVLIYALYHPVLEVAMRGRTPGKRMVHTRLVDARGGVPTVGAILIRNVFRMIDALPAFYGVGLAFTFFTARRVRVGDLAAGTILVMDRAATVDRLELLGNLAAETVHDPALVEVALDLLARWNELSEERRGRIARSVLLRLEPGAAAFDLASWHPDSLQERIRAALRPGAPR